MRKVILYILIFIGITGYTLRTDNSFMGCNHRDAIAIVSGNNTQPVAGPDGLDRNSNHLILTRHARCRMECRHINETELKEILHDGNVNYNKSEPNAKRGPKYALEGYTHEHQHLRVIFAPEHDGMVVVTCIDLDHEFACGDCR